LFVTRTDDYLNYQHQTVKPDPGNSSGTCADVIKSEVW
jgi:hypothetical protein